MPHAHMKKFVVVSCVLTALLPLGFFGRLVLVSSKIELRDAAEWSRAPLGASHIFARGSDAGFIAEFHIDEAALVADGKSRGWSFREIISPVDANRYFAADDPSRSDSMIEVKQGLIFDDMQKNGSGVRVVFDRVSGTAYLHSSSW